MDSGINVGGRGCWGEVCEEGVDVRLESHTNIVELAADLQDGVPLCPECLLVRCGDDF